MLRAEEALRGLEHLPLEPLRAEEVPALFQGEGPYASTPGFRGSVLLVDESKNSAQSITLWDDRAAFDALAATDAYRESMGALAQECFVGAPEVVEHSFAGAFFPDGGAPT